MREWYWPIGARKAHYMVGSKREGAESLCRHQLLFHSFDKYRVTRPLRPDEICKQCAIRFDKLPKA